MVQACIFPDSRRPSARPRALRSLHFSLNTPVVAIERSRRSAPRARRSPCRTLARAAPRCMLVVRSQRTGQLACFSHDEPLESDASAQIALDGALSFAESMGFLFDDDAIPELGADGPREAADSWNDLLGLAPGDLAATRRRTTTSDALETDGDDGLRRRARGRPRADRRRGARGALARGARPAAAARGGAGAGSRPATAAGSCSRNSGARRLPGRRLGATAGRSACSATSEPAPWREHESRFDALAPAACVATRQPRRSPPAAPPAARAPSRKRTPSARARTTTSASITCSNGQIEMGAARVPRGGRARAAQRAVPARARPGVRAQAALRRGRAAPAARARDRARLPRCALQSLRAPARDRAASRRRASRRSDSTTDPTFPGPWRALSNRGWAEYQLGRVDEARETFALTRKFNPVYWPALLNLGILESEQGRRPEAIQLFEAVLSQRPAPSAEVEPRPTSVWARSTSRSASGAAPSST